MSLSWNPSSADAPAAPAREVGPYRLIRRLGAGGMGDVFLAHDLRLDRQVAIKHPRADKVDEEQRARFRREAWAAARLSHPAIIPIFDVLTDGDGDWIVMEYVEGPTLREHLLATGRPPLPLALAWAVQIADGLAAAHEKGIVHRDLKAENVMLAPSGHLKIVDFGLAKSFAEGDAAALSATGAVLGTLRTMAPEQARGMAVDWRADLFSFGVLLYELVTGALPFEEKSPLALLNQLAALPHRKASTYRSELAPELDRLLDQLLAKAPEARPGGAKKVAASLREILARMGPATPPSAGTWPAAAESLDTTALAATAAAGLLAPTASPTPWQNPAAPAPALARLTWRGRAATVALASVAVLALGWGIFVVGRPFSTTPAAVADQPAALYEAGSDRLQHWYRPGNLEAAVGYFQRALEHEPHSAKTLAALSRAYWYSSKAAGRDEQRLRQALAVGEQAVASEGHLAAAQLSLGLAALELGELDKAETALRRAELLEKNAMAAYGLALLARARGQLAGAEAGFREALGRQPSAEIFNALGSLLLRQNRDREAEGAFRQAITLAPDAIFGYRNLSSALFAQGDYAGAAAALQRAIEIEPRASLYTNLGTLFFYQGLYAEARQAFQRAIDKAGEEGISTNTALLWANLGDSYRFLPNHQDDARLAFRRAVQLLRPEAQAQPDNTELRSRLGLYLAKAGEDERARAELQAALALPNLENSARVRIVLAYEALGERPAALAVTGAALAAGLELAELEREPELAALRADPAYHRLAAASPD